MDSHWLDIWHGIIFLCAKDIREGLMSMYKGICRRKGKKSLDEILQEALENAPTIQGYTIRQLAEITGKVWADSKWPLKRSELLKYRLKKRG